jgi:hypothetical protein
MLFRYFTCLTNEAKPSERDKGGSEGRERDSLKPSERHSLKPVVNGKPTERDRGDSDDGRRAPLKPVVNGCRKGALTGLMWKQ